MAAKKSTTVKPAAKPAKAKKAPAPKRNEKPAPKPKGTPAEAADATIAKLDAALAKSKQRLAPKADAKPKPEPKAKPAKKPKGTNTYEAMKNNRFTASKVENPVRAMWDLCDANTDKKRKDVIALAVESGISFYTARTQYQLWLTAYRNSK